MAKGFCDGLVVWKRYQQNELRKPHGFKALAVVSFTTGPASNIGTTDPFFPADKLFIARCGLLGR